MNKKFVDTKTSKPGRTSPILPEDPFCERQNAPQSKNYGGVVEFPHGSEEDEKMRDVTVYEEKEAKPSGKVWNSAWGCFVDEDLGKKIPE